MPQMYVNPCIVATLGVCYRPSESIIENSDSRKKTPLKNISTRSTVILSKKA